MMDIINKISSDRQSYYFRCKQNLSHASVTDKPKDE